MDSNRVSKGDDPARRFNRWTVHKPLLAVMAAQLVALAAAMVYLNSGVPEQATAQLETGANVAAER
jgi:hypothetical protein